MNIIIAGCGKVGADLAAELSQEDNNICVIDINEAVVNRVVSHYDVMGITGNCSSYSVLREAGIEEADLLLAVTESDEENLLCCVIAKKAGKCQTIARVRNPIYSEERDFLLKQLGLSMIINPEFATATAITRILCFPNALSIEAFSNRRSEMLRIRIPEDSALNGMAVKDLASRYSHNFLVCAVEHEGYVTIPAGDFILRSNDVISILFSNRQVAVDFFKKIKLKVQPVKSIMIIGGGRISVYLARALLNLGMNVKIIERNEEKCRNLSIELPEAMIINGDASDRDLLNEERITKTDAFVALTNLDEENILLSLYAKKKVRSKVVTKINRLQLDEVLETLDLDSVIYPKHLTAEKILAYVRATANASGSNVETVCRLYNDRVEALEFKIRDNPKITNIPIQQLKLRKNLLIGNITRNGQVIIPGGQDVILPGDVIIVVTSHLGLQDAQDILES